MDGQPIDSLEARSRFMALADMVESYLTAAEDVYRHNPESQSTRMLTIMELWVACDRYCTKFYPMLLEYSTGFRVDLFDALILPRKEDLVRLAALEAYLDRRQKKAVMGVPWEFAKGHADSGSFAVRYYETHSELESLHARLQEAAERARAAKKAEYQKLDDKYHAHMRKVRLASPCYHPSYDRYYCPTCQEADTARSMSINVFEEPLPTLPEDDLLAKTLVFELQVPEIYARWKDLTLRILTETAGLDPTADEPSQRRLYLTREHPIITENLGRKGRALRVRFRLASTSERSRFSHGERIRVSGATEGMVCTPHGYVYGLYDTQTRKEVTSSLLMLQLHPGFAYPPPTTHEVLRPYIVGTSHSENDVIAATTSITEFPSKMSRDEFKIFGNLRGGLWLQWRNILEQLQAPTLDFNKVETLYLILQTANEAGPEGDDGPLRQSHTILDDEAFGLRLIDALEDAFSRVKENWDSDVSWCIYLSLATRLLSMSTKSTVHNHCLLFLSEIRDRAISCVRSLRESIEESDSVQDRKDLSKQALLLALICHGTFDVSAGALPAVLKDVDEAAILVSASIFIAELTAAEMSGKPSNGSAKTESESIESLDIPITTKFQDIGVDPIMELLLHRWRRLSYVTESFLKREIVHRPDMDTCLDIAVTNIWKEYAQPKEWSIGEDDDYRHILLAKETSSGETYSIRKFQYNLLTGQFLMDGMPISSLPQDYLIDDTYRQLFGERVVKVVPKKLERTVFTTERPQFKHSPIHFGKTDDGLIIRAVITDQMYETIPRCKLERDFPPLLVSDYVHWLVEGKNRIEFRPLDKAWEPIGEAAGSHGFVLHLRAEDGSPGQLKRNKFTRLVDSGSKTWSRVTRIFQSIESPGFIHLMLTQDSHGTKVLEVDLPRYGMRFSLFPGKTSITSNHYKGFSVDSSQSFGALVGLQTKLVLRSEAPGLRAAIIPHGKLYFAKGQSGHASSWVHTGGKRPIKHHFLQIDTTLGQLKDSGALGNKLFLVYLHAITSHCLPDPLTGRTGTEEALRILNSAAVKSFDRLRKGPEDLLRHIADLSPQRYRLELAGGRIATAIWSRLSPLAQNDAFYVSVQSILDHAHRCLLFFPEKGKRKKPDIGTLKTPRDELVCRSLNRAATFRVSQFGAEEFTTSHDNKEYEARDKRMGSPAGQRTYDMAKLLANAQDNADIRTDEIDQSTLKALALALGCRTDDSNKEIEGRPEDEIQSSPPAAPTQPFEQDFNLRWFDPLPATLRHSWADVLAWLRGSNLLKAGEHCLDRGRLIMFFAALSFAEETNPEIVQLLLTFVISYKVRSIQVPVEECDLRLTDGAVFDIGRLTRLVEEHAGSSNAWPWSDEYKAHSAAVDGLIKALSEQWPCSNPDKPNDPSLYRNHLPLDAVMKDACELFGSWFRNTEYMSYLSDAIDEASLLQQEKFDYQENQSLIQRAKTIQESKRRKWVKVGHLFTQDPPAISPLQPEPFEKYLPQSSHNDSPTALTINDLIKELFKDCQEGHEHQKEYVKRLEQSMSELKARPVEPYSMHSENDELPKEDSKNETVKKLKECQDAIEKHLKECQDAVENMRALITQTLKHPPHLAGCEAILSPLLPRVTTVLLLEQLSRRRRSPLSPGWKRVIVSFAHSIRVLQRAERLASAVGLPTDLAKDELLRELNDTAGMKPIPIQPESEGLQSEQPDWDRMDHLDSLLLEVENGIFIRPVQESIARHMMHPGKANHTVMQLNMGEGKSSVIIPIVAAALANSQSEVLVRVFVTKPQFKLMMQTLGNKLGRLLNRRIYTLPVSRGLRLNKEGATTLRALCDECRRNGGILLLQVDHILSLRLLGLEKVIVDSDDTTGRAIIEGLSKFEDLARDIVDEADEVFNPRYELTYAMGTQQDLNFGRQRWQLIQDMLSAVAKVAPGQHDEDNLGLEVETRDDLHNAFPKVRITQDSATPVLVNAIAKQICNKGLEGLPTVALNSHPELTQAFIQYITQADPDQSIVDKMKEISISQAKRPYVLLLRGLLAHGVLCFVLKKRWTVDYGLDLERKPRIRVAVPYLAKDWPSPRSEFSHPDVVIVCTCLSYFYRGLTDGELTEAFQHLCSMPERGNSEYDAWVKNNPYIPPGLRHLTGVNLRDTKQCADDIFKHLRHSKIVIDYYLSNILFARQMREFPKKLSASPWDLTGHRTHLLTGFSGTNDSREMLPLPVHYLDLHPHTNAAVLDCLLRSENTVQEIDIRMKGKRSAAESILELLSSPSTNIRVIIDVGAQVLDMKNLEFAKAWLRRVDEKTAEAVIVFDEKGDLVVLTRDGRAEAFLASPYSMHTSACLVFLDEAHTRGTDLRLPPDYRAAVTLGPNLTKDKLVQACMRMRRLGRGQSVEFLVSDEIAEKLRNLPRFQENGELQVIHILRWAISETWRESEKTIGLYAMQGIRHQRHEILWKEARDGTGMRRKIARKFLDDEAKTLEQRYRPTLEAETVDGRDVFEKDVPTSVQSARAGQIKQIKKKCHDFGIRSMNATGVDEEQERELAPEVEEQRALERPAALVPLTPRLDEDVLEFARSGTIDANSKSKAFMSAFETFETTSVGREENDVLSEFPKDLLATREFAQTVESQESSTFQSDHYHRPVHWVMTSTAEDGNVEQMVLLSPWEANELLRLGELAGGGRVYLHMYAPRMSPSLRPLEDLALYTTPALPQNWIVRPGLIRLLNLFAGQLYLRSYNEYIDVCKFLGLPYRNVPLDMKMDGFLGDRKDKDCCPFSQSPIPLLRHLLQSICRDNQDIRRSDMGRILASGLLEEDDFEERLEYRQLFKTIQNRRAAQSSQDELLPSALNRWQVKDFGEIFESDYLAFPFAEYHTRSEAKGFAENKLVENLKITSGIAERTGQDVLTQGPIDDHERAWKDDVPPTSDENRPVTFASHEEDVTTSSTCSKCRCKLCHARRDDEHEEGQSSDSRWSINLKVLQSSARQCSSCDLLFNIASKMRQGSKLAACMKLEYRSELKQLFAQLLDGDGKPLNPGWFEMYRTQEKVTPKRTSASNRIFSDSGLAAGLQSPSVPWIGIPMRPHVTTIASVNESAEWIKHKLARCSQHHECYGPDTRLHRLPTRVVDLRSKSVALDAPIRLHVSEKDERALYATLSHCWGESQYPKALNEKEGSKVEDLQAGIPFDCLPPTYVHAIMLARKLGLEFLWIDSLCIIQDDKEDWTRQAADVGRIYRESYLTIAATAGADGESGLFWGNTSASAPGDRITATLRPKSKPSGREASAAAAYKIFARRALTHSGFTGDGFTGGGGGLTPLITRSWVYQERALSPRVAHFCTAELVWECEELFACECGGAQNDPSLPATVKQAPATQGRQWKQTYAVLRMAREDVVGLQRHPAFKRWRWRLLVGEYARLALFSEDDRLPALAGIPSGLFADMDRGRYLAGLWEDTLHLDLQWVVTGPRETLPLTGIGNGNGKGNGRGEREYIAPSWSWASKATAFPDYGTLVLGDEESKPAFELIAARCEPMISAGNEFGRLKDGSHLVLRGDFAEVRLQLVALPALKEARAAIVGELGTDAQVFMDYKLGGDDQDQDQDLVEVNPPMNEIASLRNAKSGAPGTKVIKELSEVFYAVRLTAKSTLLLRRVGYDTDIYERIGLALKLQSFIYTHSNVIFQLV